MRRIAACIACFGLVSAMAADPARLAEARAMMKSMQVDKMMDAMVDAMTAGMARQMTEFGARRDDPRMARIAMEESGAVMREQAMRPGGLIDAMTEAYADEFSVDELRQIRAFHESAVGKHMLESSPRMMQRVMQGKPFITKDEMLQVCERVNARMQREKVAGEPMKCGQVMK